MTRALRARKISNYMLRSCRRSGYRTAIHFLYGKLGRGRRRPVPACIGQFCMLKLYANALNFSQENKRDVSQRRWYLPGIQTRESEQNWKEKAAIILSRLQLNIHFLLYQSPRKPIVCPPSCSSVLYQMHQVIDTGD
jgi:hypothetical protein